MMGTYSPKISSMVEPLMPGSTMAQMAIMAHTKMYPASSGDREPISTLVPWPPVGFTAAMTSTRMIPRIMNRILLVRRRHSFSSFIIRGREKMEKPRNRELSS